MSIAYKERFCKIFSIGKMKKLNEHEIQQLIDKANDLHVNEISRGESYFAALEELHPEKAVIIKGTYLDPTSNDSKISVLLKYLRGNGK